MQSKTAVIFPSHAKIPEASKLVSAPTKENGRALWEAIKAKDLTSVVGSKLPKEFK